ncbi:hypothetical protein K440DRAFT_636122, partial [Wilcoxina mikolae CBS 423.85]
MYDTRRVIVSQLYAEGEGNHEQYGSEIIDFTSACLALERKKPYFTALGEVNAPRRDVDTPGSNTPENDDRDTGRRTDSVPDSTNDTDDVDLVDYEEMQSNIHGLEHEDTQEDSDNTNDVVELPDYQQIPNNFNGPENEDTSEDSD